MWNPATALGTQPDRTIGNGTLNDGDGLPVLLRQTGRLGPAPFPSEPAYPLIDPVTEDVVVQQGGALESQSLLPLTDPVEMGHENRAWPEILADLAPPRTLDNFEGIAAHRAADGTTRITLLSDDNFNVLQRTLIVQFELVED